MNTLQRVLLSFGIIVISSLIIYFLIIYFKKTRKKMQHNKMLTMNLVIKYNPFLEYLNYQIENNERFYIYLLKINNFKLLEKQYDDNIVKSYLRMIAKELSVYLPFGGKISQTNKRDTFIIYYPETNEDVYFIGERFKSLANKTYNKNGLNISKGNSIGVLNHEDFEMKNLNYALVKSIRTLGKVTIYNKEYNLNYNDFISSAEKLYNSYIKINSYNVEKIYDSTYKEIYNELVIDGVNLKDYLLSYSIYDQAWINIYMIEYLLNVLYENNQFNNITIPVLFKTLENELFYDVIEKMILSNYYSPDKIILTIYDSNESYNENIVKNLLNLSNLGIKTSLKIKSLNNNIYSLIQKYNINRVIVNDNVMNDENIAELLYYCKVNYLEVFYETNKSLDNISNLNVTHIKTNEIKLKDIIKRKRGRK